MHTDISTIKESRQSTQVLTKKLEGMHNSSMEGDISGTFFFFFEKILSIRNVHWGRWYSG
jgi:hypothetical protein